MTKPQPALLPEGEGGREPGCCSGADLTPYRKCFSVFTGVRFSPGSTPRPTLNLPAGEQLVGGGSLLVLPG